MNGGPEAPELHAASRVAPEGSGLAAAASGLLGQALASDDAEAEGLRADDVLADPEVAVVVLGGLDPWSDARHAVVQRYGRVGALLVMGYEGRGRVRRGEGDPNPPELERLLEHFAEMDAQEIRVVLSAVGRHGGGAHHGDDDEATLTRQWLDATYAVAARDGTDAAHRAYMEALDRVMRLAARRLTS